MEGSGPGENWREGIGRSEARKNYEQDEWEKILFLIRKKNLYFHFNFTMNLK